MPRHDLPPTTAPSIQDEPIYDLVTARADYPPWSGKPRRTLLLCSHPRSGSTLLGETLHGIGGFGCPLEYLHVGFRPKFMARWQAPTLSALLEATYRHRTDVGGVLSAKLFWLDIEDLLAELAPPLWQRFKGRGAETVPAAAYRELHGLLRDCFPEPTFVYLSRRDRVRQAISAWVAIQNRQWRSIPDLPAPTATGSVEYDYERIHGLIALADHCNGHWRNFFAANAIQPLALAYEDLVAPDSPALRGLLAALGYTGPLPAPRMRRQANADSERLMARFLRDHHASGAKASRRQGDGDTGHAG